MTDTGDLSIDYLEDKKVLKWKDNLEKVTKHLVFSMTMKTAK